MARDVTVTNLCEASIEEVIHAPTFSDDTDTERLNIVVRSALFVSLRSGSTIGISEKILLTDEEFAAAGRKAGMTEEKIGLIGDAQRALLVAEACALAGKPEWPWKTGNTYRITFHGEPVGVSSESSPQNVVFTECPECGVAFQYDLEAKQPKGCSPGTCVNKKVEAGMTADELAEFERRRHERESL
jgi:hypothetical protein